MSNQGTFVWYELYTDQPEKARVFYGEVLGWKTETLDMGGQPYEMIKNGDAMFGGLMKAKPGQPNHWLSYLEVDDVDARAEAIAKDGGKVIQSPFDIPPGRLAPVVDREGIPLVLFHSKDAPPERGAPAHGDIHWNELWAKDEGVALDFYKRHFGLTAEAFPVSEQPYHILKSGKNATGGLMKAPPGAPSLWLQYVRVDDVDATVERAVKLGGAAMGPLMDAPTIGRFGVIQDPSGAAFGVIKPEA